MGGLARQTVRHVPWVVRHVTPGGARPAPSQWPCWSLAAATIHASSPATASSRYPLSATSRSRISPNDSADFPLRADPGKILLVYFGYTNCPDFCPNTMANIKLARQQLDDPAQVEMAMVTVDPGRDLDTLASYVTGFIPDGHALGTDDDDAALARAASAFGVSYDVSTDASGETEVAHTTLLYAVDDDGQVVLAWPFGVSIDDLAADID